MRINMEKLYKASELAKVLRLSPRQIYRLAESGEIQSYRIGKSIRFEMPGQLKAEKPKKD